MSTQMQMHKKAFWKEQESKILSDHKHPHTWGRLKVMEYIGAEADGSRNI